MQRQTYAPIAAAGRRRRAPEGGAHVSMCVCVCVFKHKSKSINDFYCYGLQRRRRRPPPPTPPLYIEEKPIRRQTLRRTHTHTHTGRYVYWKDRLSESFAVVLVARIRCCSRRQKLHKNGSVFPFKVSLINGKLRPQRVVREGVERRGEHNVLLFQLQAAPKYERIIYQAAPPLSNSAIPSPGKRITQSVSLPLSLSLSLCLASACGFEIGYNNAVINGCQSERVNKCQAQEDADKTPIDSDNNSNNYNNSTSRKTSSNNNNNCYETEVRLSSIYGFITLK